MKKTIIALSVALMGAFAVNAQTSATTTCDNAKQCSTPVCANPGCTPDSYCPFAGIELTADQQTKIKALNADRQKKIKEAREQASKKDAKARGCLKDARKNYLAKVKEILTPEQYIQFLENNYIENGRQGKGKGDMRKGGRKDFRKDGGRRDMKVRAPRTSTNE